jgi:hypothetical protein
VSWVSRGLSVLKTRMIVSSVLKVDALTAAVAPIVEKYIYWSDDRQTIHFDHVRAYVTGRRTVVPVCKECNLSKSDKGLKELRLRWVRDIWPDKWNAIVDYNKGKRNRNALAFRDVRGEY